MSDTATRVRVLLLAAHGSSREFVALPTPIQLHSELVFEMQELNFRHEELVEYVDKCSEGFKCLQDVIVDGAPALEDFYTRLSLGATSVSVRQQSSFSTANSQRAKEALVPHHQLKRLRGKLRGKEIVDELRRTRADHVQLASSCMYDQHAIRPCNQLE